MQMHVIVLEVLTQNDASRFLEELPEAFLDRTFAGGGARNQSNFNNMGSAFARMHQRI